MIRVRLTDAGQLDGLLDADRLRRAHRGGLTTGMPYGPHTADDRERMLGALGLTSVDELFDDIPAGAPRLAPRPARIRNPSSSWRPA